MDLYPQQLFTAERAAAGAFFFVFFEKKDIFFEKGQLLLIVVCTLCFTCFGKHQIDVERNVMQNECRFLSRAVIYPNW